MFGARTERLSREPEDTAAPVEAVTLYHMVIEGMSALTGRHFIMDFNERENTLPGFVEGFGNVARDERRPGRRAATTSSSSATRRRRRAGSPAPA